MSTRNPDPERPSDTFGVNFEPSRQMSQSLSMLRSALLWVGRRPYAGIGVRTLRRAEHFCLRTLRDRLDDIGGPADPLGNSPSADSDQLPSNILKTLLAASRGTDQDAIEHDFYVRVLRQLNPSQARILVLMADGRVWPMVHVTAGSLLSASGERVLSFASSVGKEAGVLLRPQVPHFIAHMWSLGLINAGPEDDEQEPEYEILEADTLVRETMRHIQDDRGEYAHIERCSIRLSEFGLALCAVSLSPDDPAPLER